MATREPKDSREREPRETNNREPRENREQKDPRENRDAGVPRDNREPHEWGLIELEEEDTAGKLTPWILFLIFVFGPCEVLIPMLIFPAANHSAMGVFLVALVFGIATIGTMLAVVFLGYKGFSLIRFKGREYQFHLLAGMVILLAGTGMQFMGW